MRRWGIHIALLGLMGIGGVLATGRAWAVEDQVSPVVTRLSKALDHYRELARKGGWPEVSLPKDGRAAKSARALRARLIATGDYHKTSGVSEKKELQEAIRAFQRRHGLTETGEVGDDTHAALDVPLATRIQMLETALARATQAPQDFPERYAVLNIPAYELRVIENKHVTLRMRAIVGKPTLPTPTLASTISEFIVNPYWDVPRSIATREMLPKIKQDPTYLARNHLKVIDTSGNIQGTVNWDDVDETHFPYRLRQDYGAGNALGLVKFIFPNPYSVYLHDTDTQQLFQETMRAKSHGCIRIEKPQEFAHLLAADNSSYTPAQIDALFAGKKQVRVKLTKPLPLYVEYTTAEVDEDGVVYFWKDVYRLDR